MIVKIAKFLRLINDRNELSLTNILLVAFSIKFLLLPSDSFSNMSSVFCTIIPLLSCSGMYLGKNYMHKSEREFDKKISKQKTVKIDSPD